MSLTAILLLLLTVALSVGRNLLSKSISGTGFGERRFFLFQSCIFLSGGLVTLFAISPDAPPARETIFLSILYGVCLIFSQWCYTAALRGGKLAVCSTVYSLGFVFPTLSGLYWGETLTGWNVLGVLLVAATIFLSAKRDGGESGNRFYILPLLCAMLSSGGLGILQKVQQKSAHPDEKAFFILFAFCFAALVSFAVSFFAKKGKTRPAQKIGFLFAAGVGLCFGGCNLLNTTLAGMLDSVVFFPTLNIGVILATLLSGIVVFRERPRPKDLAVVLLCIGAVLLLNFK